MTLTTPVTSHISIIIPTLNEEENLGGLLDHLQACEGLEVIVADGGSSDQTVGIARSHGIRVVTSPAGRSIQLNAGAEQSSGTILLFLHCDSRLPDNFSDQIRSILHSSGTAAGAFRLHIDAEGSGFRLVEWGANLRSRVLGLPYGDQGLFVSRTTFAAAGGFPDQPLLEDLLLICRLKRIGKVKIAQTAVATSPRRWKRLGVLKTTLINQAILAGCLMGIKPEKLARLYNR